MINTITSGIDPLTELISKVKEMQRRIERLEKELENSGEKTSQGTGAAC